MIRSEFERAQEDLKQGDTVVLTLRGNYGDYTITGILTKIEDGRIYLAHEFSHHYKRVVSMCKMEAEK